MAARADSAVTISSPIPARVLVIAFIGMGACLLAAVGVSSWITQLPAAAIAAYSGVAAFACTWLLARAWRMGVGFDDHGITIRNPLRTYRVSWPEVSHLSDGFVATPNNPLWALKVVLRDGRAITAKCMASEVHPPAWMLDEIRVCAARYGIRAKLKGEPT